MKINDIVLSEAPMNAQQLRAAQDAAAGKPQAPAVTPAAPAKTATKKSGQGTQNRAPGSVAPQPTLGGKPSTGPKGQAWLKKYGATHNPDGTPKAAAQQADPSIDPYDPNKDPNVQMAQPSAGSSAELDRMKQLAIGGNQPQGQATQPEPATADTPADQATADQTQTSNYTGVDQRTANARDANAAPPVQGYAGQQAQVPTFGQPETSNYTGVDQRTANARDQQGQATQPAKDPTEAPAVKTGTGGNVTSSSDDELAWVAKNGGSFANRGMYPGPGNWDPKTGATTRAADKALAASGANPWEGKDPAKAAAWAALSPEDQKWIGKGDPTDKFILARAPSKGGFLGSITPNFMKKDKGQPAAPNPQQGQGTQPTTVTGPNPPAGGYGRFQESELSAIKRLSGLK